MIIIAFTATVFVHELGHFIAARRAGVQVLTFSIGMGPRLLTLFKDKKGTEWVVCLLPLGGYVQLKGQSDNPFDLNPKNKDANDYRSKRPLQRLSIVLAGVVMNVIFSYILLVWAYTLGVPFISNTLGGVKPGSSGEKLGFEAGDVIKSINEKKVESWEDYLTYINTEFNKEMVVSIERNGALIPIRIKPENIETQTDADDGTPLKDLGIFPERKALISGIAPSLEDRAKELGVQKGDVVVSLKLQGETKVYRNAFGVIRLIQNNPGKTVDLELEGRDGAKKTLSLKIASETKPNLNEIQTEASIFVPKGGNAEKQGLKEGDVIVSISNKAARGWLDVYNDLLAEGEKGSPIPIKVLRGRETLLLQVKPLYDGEQERFLLGISPQKNRESRRISYVPDYISKMFSPPKVGDILLETKVVGENVFYTLERNGDNLRSIIPLDKLKESTNGHLFDFSIKEKIVKYPLVDSIRHSLERSLYEIRSSLIFLKDIAFGQISTKLIGGPIRIFQVSHFVAENKTLSYFLLLFAKIGFGLAIINLLPIPALDGGYALFILAEILRGKPVSEKLAMKLHQIGVLLLLGLMIFVFYNDINSIFF